MDETIRKRSSLLAAAETAFEHFLWHFRVVIVLGVIGLVTGSCIVFFYGIVETAHLLMSFVKTMWIEGGQLAHDSTGGRLTYNAMIMGLITVVDDFLIGIVLLIFGLGSYDLFISRIDAALEQGDIRPDWLVFGSLDELKSVLGKVVLMILVINFLRLTIETTFKGPLDLMYLGAGIALVSLGLKLTHGKDIEMTKAVMRVKPHHPEDEDEDEDEATNGEQGGKRQRKGRSSAEAPAHAER
jgi:uncharacterized membrane protein YqhA